MVKCMKNSKNNSMNQEKVNYKMLFLFIGFALVAGFLGSLLGGNMSSFKTLKKPFFTPPPPSVSNSMDYTLYINGYIIILNML